MSFVEYIQETKGEMRHVSWPNRRQVVVFTVTVVAASITVSLFLGLFDFIFGAGLRALVRLSPDRGSVEAPRDLSTGTTSIPSGAPAGNDGGADTPTSGNRLAPPPGAPAPTGPDLEFAPF